MTGATRTIISNGKARAAFRLPATPEAAPSADAGRSARNGACLAGPAALLWRAACARRRRDIEDKVFIDVGGQGAGVFDILNSWGEPYCNIVEAVDFAGSPQLPEIILPNGEKRPGPENRRAEMWMRSRDWLDEPGGADIPDEDSLQTDACAPQYHYNVNQYLLIESKEKMRKRGVRSPDEWDAVALTFASPVREKPKRSDPRNAAAGGWMGYAEGKAGSRRCGVSRWRARRGRELPWCLGARWISLALRPSW